MSTATLTEVMTVRLIDADALGAKIEALMDKYAAMGKPNVAQDYNFVLTALACAPTIDTTPGTWKRVRVYAMECSECKTYLPREEWERCIWKFCPVCGADMRGGSDGRGKT